MNNKGFTLLEMVVTVALLSIVIAGVVVIFPNWMNQYDMLKETAAATEIMDVVASGIQEELSLSQERQWDENGLSYVNGDRLGQLPLEDSQSTTSYTNGTLVISGQPKIYGAVFDTEFYKDMTVTLTLQEKERKRDNSVFLLAIIEVHAADGELLCSERKTIFYYNP